ncbi:MAG: hypothetical protein GVY28_06275 [Alphaproteobacteria bacterium]|jgi:hypothetical protein|nr:hypothetical protein [Alphaproteobacteria bacterium]
MRIAGSIQTIGLTTLITVLIWLYAEGQNVRRSEPRRINLQLPARVGQDTVVDWIGGGRSMPATVSFKGASAALTELEAHLEPAGAIRLPLTAGDLPDKPRHTLDLKTLLAEARVNPDSPGGRTITDLGVSVDTVDPAQVDVRIEKLVQRELRVVFQPEGIKLGPSLTIEPTRLDVTLPRSLSERYASSPDALYVEAVARPGQLQDMPKGVAQTLTLSLQPGGVLEGADHVKLARTSADVTFTIRGQTDSYPLKLVPVWLRVPPSETQRYDVALDADSRVLSEVLITGPKELIERLRADAGDRAAEDQANLRVVAVFSLTADELDRGITSKPLNAVEIEQVGADGTTRLLHTVPLNPEALAVGQSPPPPTFVSPTITVTTPTPRVSFTVTRRKP